MFRVQYAVYCTPRRVCYAEKQSSTKKKTTNEGQIPEYFSQFQAFAYFYIFSTGNLLHSVIDDALFPTLTIT